MPIYLIDTEDFKAFFFDQSNAIQVKLLKDLNDCLIETNVQSIRQAERLEQVW